MAGTLTRESLQKYQFDQQFPCFFLRSAAPAVLREVDEHLLRQGPTTTLFFVLKLAADVASDLPSLSRGGYWLSEGLDRSFQTRIHPIRDAWHKLVTGHGPWSGLLEFRNIHAFGVRGPTSKIRRFLQSETFRNEDSPLAGFIRPFRTLVPEQAVDWSVLEDLDPTTAPQFEHVDRKFREAMLDGRPDPDRISELLTQPDIASAVDLYQKLIRMLPWLKVSYVADAVRRVLQRIGPDARRLGGAYNPPSYLNSLGIGNVSRFGDHGGAGQKVIILDSGADESSLFLQRQIVDYRRIDGSAQRKDAHDCVDVACHGTKMSSVVAGKGISLQDLGLTADYVSELLIEDSLADFGLSETDILRPGIAPGVRLAIGEVLRGDLFSEGGAAYQLMSGLDWAASNNMSSYGILNLSMEVDPAQYGEADRETANAILDLLRMNGIVTVMAAGNRGPKSMPLATRGIIVGAADEQGWAVPDNGPLVDVLGPGQNIVCGQPRLDRLRNMAIAVHNGSSFATAIVSGSIALLAAEHRVSAINAANALVSSSGGGIISLDRASKLL